MDKTEGGVLYTDDKRAFDLSAPRMRSLTLFTNSSFELQRTSSVRFFKDSKCDARNLHCLTSSNECTSEAAI